MANKIEDRLRALERWVLVRTGGGDDHSDLAARVDKLEVEVTSIAASLGTLTAEIMYLRSTVQTQAAVSLMGSQNGQ